MARYLIVANQTLGGAQLDDAVRERIAQGQAWFFVVVPVTAMEHEAAIAGLGFSMAGEMMTYPSREILEQDVQRREQMLEDSLVRAEERLERMIARVSSLGGEVEGAVGDPDPVLATRDVLGEHGFDEVIVSTLPARISRWLRMDLPSQIGRMTELPVITVEASEDDGDADRFRSA